MVDRPEWRTPEELSIEADTEPIFPGTGSPTESSVSGETRDTSFIQADQMSLGGGQHEA